jgi:hypothetical protein
MAHHNPIRQHYYGFITCGLIAIIAVLLSILRVPVAVRLSLLVVAAIVFVTILSKAGRAADH